MSSKTSAEFFVDAQIPKRYCHETKGGTETRIYAWKINQRTLAILWRVGDLARIPGVTVDLHLNGKPVQLLSVGSDGSAIFKPRRTR